VVGERPLARVLAQPVPGPGHRRDRPRVAGRGVHGLAGAGLHGHAPDRGGPDAANARGRSAERQPGAAPRTRASCRSWTSRDACALASRCRPSLPCDSSSRSRRSGSRASTSRARPAAMRPSPPRWYRSRSRPAPLVCGSGAARC
jgi:hypothetical protein